MIIERESYKEIIKHIRNSPEATIITGMRRTGKTSLLKYAYDNIDSKSSKVFLDLENPINQKRFEEEDYDKIKIVFEKIDMPIHMSHHQLLIHHAIAMQEIGIRGIVIDHHFINLGKPIGV